MGRCLSSIIDRPESSMLSDLGTGSDTLIVTFASLGGASGIATFEFYKSLFDFDVDKLFIRDITTSWYQQGVEGVSTSLTGTARYLKELIARHKYRRVVFLGYSMGGYAAIAHGVLAGADIVLSLGPQTFLDPANRERTGDRRWSGWLSRLPDSIDTSFLDLKGVLETTPYATHINIYFSAGCAIDRCHAEHLAACPHVTLHRVDESESHMVAVELKKRGELYLIIRNALSLHLEDRLLGVWKDRPSLGLDAALARHQVSLADFNDYRGRQRDVTLAQEPLLRRFFAALDDYIPTTFGLECVNDQVPSTFRHNDDCYRRWFAESKRSRYFGSFFALPESGLLLHLELGTHKLHIGLVRCRREADGCYTLLRFTEEECDLLLQALAPLRDRKLPLARRTWGPNWCSVDCGWFHNPEMYGTYLAMTNFPRSSLFRHTVKPFIETVMSTEMPAVFRTDHPGRRKSEMSQRKMHFFPSSFLGECNGMTNFDSYLFTPGPVKIPQYILDIGGRQTPYFRNKSFSELFWDCERMLLAIAGAPSGSRVVFFASSGTGAMEAAVINLLSRQDRAIVINGGGFGQRFVDICRFHDLPLVEHHPDGDNLSSPAVLEAYKGTSSALLVNAHETTTGVLYDLDAIGGHCRKNKVFLIVDAISMFITDRVNMSEQGIDALIISSHKGLALPPGVSMVILSPAALTRIGQARSYYFDFRRSLEDGVRGQTPFTPAVTIMLQLHARLRQVTHDSVEHEIDKARGIADYFREHVAAWPLAFFSRFMPNAMTALKTTNGQSALEIVEMLSTRHNVVVAPCGGALQEVVFRVSHMGDMTTAYVDVLISALDQLYGVKR